MASSSTGPDAESAAGQSQRLAGFETKGLNVVVPERVAKKLDEAKSFAEFRDLRTFRFLYMYSGPRDVLAECKKHQISFKPFSLDQKIDPGIDLSDAGNRQILEDEVTQGEFDYFHAGFPCNIFSRARWNPGRGPGPLRSAEEIYGLSSNTEAQQQQADKGTVMATSASSIMKKQCRSCKMRGVPDMATLENPPGDDRAGSAWAERPGGHQRGDGRLQYMCIHGGKNQMEEARTLGRKTPGTQVAVQGMQVPSMGEPLAAGREAGYREGGGVPREAVR